MSTVQPTLFKNKWEPTFNETGSVVNQIRESQHLMRKTTVELAVKLLSSIVYTKNLSSVMVFEHYKDYHCEDTLNTNKWRWFWWRSKSCEIMSKQARDNPNLRYNMWFSGESKIFHERN